MYEDAYKYMIDKKAKRYIEIDSDKYIETGEIVTVGIPVKREEIVASLIDAAPNNGFQIFRDTIMYRLLYNMGAKGRVVAFLLKKKPESNVLEATIKEIYQATGVSVQTISDCLKMLEKAKLISIKSSGPKKEIFVNPGVAHRGNRYREKTLMKEFEKFMKESEKMKESEATDADN